ncbi:MAG: PAS domain S-box protein [Isosphaeraceae bacterium]
MPPEDDEERRLRSVALQNANAIQLARQQAEEDLVRAKEDLEARTRELAHSLAMMRATLEATSDGILVTDGDRKVTGYNEKFTTMWNLPRESFASGDHSTLLAIGSRAFNDPAAFLARVDEIYATAPLESFDVLELADGRWIERSSRIQFVEGRDVGRVWSFRDVTQRKRDERDRARLAAIVESSDDAIVSKTLEGVITSWNSGAERLFGHTREEALGRSISLIIPPDRMDEEREILRRLNRGERMDHTETVRVTKDGRRIHVSISVSPILDDEGNVTGISKIARDVSERKKAEAERERLLQTIEAERERLAEVFQLSPAFLAVLRGPDHVFELANERCSQLVGHRDLLGKPIREALPELEGQRFFELLDAVYRSGTAFVGTEMRTMIGHGEGAPPEERFLDFVYQPLRDHDGAVSGILLHGVDLTERRRAEAAVRERDERLQLFLEAATDHGLIMIDPHGRILEWRGGAERITGWREAEVLGGGTDVLYTPEDRASGLPQSTLRQAAEFGKADGRRWQLRRDGSRFFADSVVTCLRTTSGRLRGFGMVLRDATERKQAEDALRDADRRKDEFLALLAHELRNPLAPLRNGLQVLRLATADSKVIVQAREMMERQLGHMVRLIDDLLDVSRISRNKMSLRRERVTLDLVVSSAVETAGPVIQQAGHELSVSLPPEPVTLDADLTRLAQVLSNLLTNSAKYTAPGGRIWLDARRDGTEVIVTVRDNGIGIPAEALPKLFDMFSQIDRSLERVTGGLGIGLALVKGLTEMHGGTVEVESAGAGEGSTFRVRLPVADVAADPTGHGPREPESAAGPAHRILVVDDSRDSALTMATVLRLLGNEVRTSHDGIEAVEAAREFQPDVILMDVGMPRLNGYEAARRIRDQPGGRDVTIFALTGWGQRGDQERSKAAGCDAHLVKPVDIHELEKLLAGVKRGSRAGA